MTSFSRFTKVLIVVFAFALLAHGAAWFLVSQFPSGDAPLVLRFRSGGGVDFLGARATLKTIPLIGSLILLMNFLLVLVLRKRDQALAVFCALAALVVENLLALSLAVLLAVNRG